MHAGRRLISPATWFRSPTPTTYTILDQLRLPDSVLTRAVMQMVEYKGV